MFTFSIHNYQKLKTIQTDLNRRMNVVSLYDGLPSEIRWDGLGLRFSSVVEHLPSKGKALVQSPGLERKQTNKQAKNQL